MIRSFFRPLAVHLVCLLLLVHGVAAQEIPTRPSDFTFDPEALTLPAVDTSGHPAHNLFDRVSVIFNADTATSMAKYLVSHTLRQINSIQGVEAFNKIYVPLRPDWALEMLSVRVIRGGKVVAEQTLRDAREVEEEGVRYVLLALEGVVPESRIESIQVLRVHVDFTSTQPIQRYVPTERARMDLIAPNEVVMQSRAYNCPDKVTEIKGDRYYATRREWSSLPALEEEEYAFPDQHAVRVEYRLDKYEGRGKGVRWAAIGSNYYEDVFSEMEASGKTVAKILAAAGVKPSMPAEEKIRAIENHLKSTIAIESGIPSEKMISRIVSSGYADNYSFIRMMMFCLAGAGVNFEVVMTCDREDKRFDKTFESDAFTDEILLYFPDTGEYLDPTVYDMRYPLISAQLLGQDCLRIRREEISGSIVPVITTGSIPENDPEESRSVEEYHLRFDPGFAAFRLKDTRKYLGYSDMGLRALLHIADEEDDKKIVEEWFKTFFTQAELVSHSIRNTDLSNPAEMREPLEIIGELKGEEIMEFTGNKVIVRIGEVIGKQSELYQQKERVHPVDLTFNHQYERHIVMDIPDGYELRGAEQLHLDHRFSDASGAEVCGFVSEAHTEGSQLHITIREYYNRLAIPVSDYARFAEVINAAADFNKLTVILQPSN